MVLRWKYMEILTAKEISSRGGKNRWKNITKEERTKIMRKVARKRWRVKGVDKSFDNA